MGLCAKRREKITFRNLKFNFTLDFNFDTLISCEFRITTVIIYR